MLEISGNYSVILISFVGSSFSSKKQMFIQHDFYIVIVIIFIVYIVIVTLYLKNKLSYELH